MSGATSRLETNRQAAVDLEQFRHARPGFFSDGGFDRERRGARQVGEAFGHARKGVQIGGVFAQLDPDIAEAR